MYKLNVNRQAKKLDMVKRLDLCIKTCSVNAALEWPLIVPSLRHTCAIIMLSNQYLDMPHL